MDFGQPDRIFQNGKNSTADDSNAITTREKYGKISTAEDFSKRIQDGDKTQKE